MMARESCMLRLHVRRRRFRVPGCEHIILSMNHRSAVAALALALSACSDDPRLDTARDPAEATCACPLDVQLDNLGICASPATAFAPAHVFSSHRVDGGVSMCEPWRDPQPVPSRPWSAVRISAPCAGDGRLCVTLRAGRAESPTSDDCTLTERCVSFEYTDAGVVADLSPLGAWAAQTGACTQRYDQEGGYLEFRSDSAELGCGTSTSMRRVAVCPARCQDAPTGQGCDVCGGPAIMTRF